MEKELETTSILGLYWGNMPKLRLTPSHGSAMGALTSMLPVHQCTGYEYSANLPANQASNDILDRCAGTSGVSNMRVQECSRLIGAFVTAQHRMW